MLTTPRRDGYRMPGEFEPHSRTWMLWPERRDTWRQGAEPARRAYAEVAKAIRRFEPVTVGATGAALAGCRALLPGDIDVVEIDCDDAWARDTGPTFLTGGGGLRAADWRFNAYGGAYDGLYPSWERDDAVAERICGLVGAERYRADFVLEGGSFQVDGEGTAVTTEMCLLSPGRNPQLNRAQIEARLLEYLGCEKLIWLRDGIDPGETNGHVDDVMFFVRPGEVACIYTEDETNPFYPAAQAAYRTLCQAADARGRRLRVHKLCLPEKPVRLAGAETIEPAPGAAARKNGDLCIASYANLYIVNGGVIVPQYGDENDSLALAQVAQLFPERRVLGVYSREIVYGGGNIHCITQQQPRCQREI